MARKSAEEMRTDIALAMKTPPLPVGKRLTKKQLAKYVEITNQRVEWSYSEIELIVQYVETLDEIEKLRKNLAINGYTGFNSKGDEVERPQSKILDRVMKRNQTVLRQIGLTASDKRNENTKGKKVRQTIEDGEFEEIHDDSDDVDDL